MGGWTNGGRRSCTRTASCKEVARAPVLWPVGLAALSPLLASWSPLAPLPPHCQQCATVKPSFTALYLSLPSLSSCRMAPPVRCSLIAFVRYCSVSFVFCPLDSIISSIALYGCTVHIRHAYSRHITLVRTESVRRRFTPRTSPQPVVLGLAPPFPRDLSIILPVSLPHRVL